MLMNWFKKEKIKKSKHVSNEHRQPKLGWYTQVHTYIHTYMCVVPKSYLKWKYFKMLLQYKSFITKKNVEKNLHKFFWFYGVKRQGFEKFYSIIISPLLIIIPKVQVSKHIWIFHNFILLVSNYHFPHFVALLLCFLFTFPFLRHLRLLFLHTPF